MNLPPVDKLPVIAEPLPDPFVMLDGSRVKTADDWNRRRAELKEQFQYYMFGHFPPTTAKVASKELSSTHSEALKATAKQILVTVTADTDRKVVITPEGGAHGPVTLSIEYHLEVTIPDGKGPFPAVIKGDLNWGKLPEAILKDAVGRGYVVVEFNREEVAPDKNDRTRGAFLLFPDCDMSTETAWAWGFHRTVDVLLTMDCVDKAKIIVTGHSRGGKAALLAGAFDDRVALTVPNGSGCGGAGSFRFLGPKCEDIVAITKNFPYWFCPRFREFIGKIDQLPIDQHELKALVAPRALLSTDGLGDIWANPTGTQATYQAARVVFEWLGAGDKCGLRYREGKHAQNEEDWAALLDFADKVLLGKTVDRKFDMPPFPDQPKKFSWSAPSKPEK